MKVMRLEQSSGLAANLARLCRERPDIVVARLEAGNLPVTVPGVKLVSLLELEPGRGSGLRYLLVRAQARSSFLFVALDRPAGVASAMRWGLPLDKIRILADDDGAIIDEVVAEVRFGRQEHAWHRR
jgi:hypothetical protein